MHKIYAEVEVVVFHEMPANDFFFNATETTEIYTLSLHDALPISVGCVRHLDRSEPDILGRQEFALLIGTSRH